MPSPVWPRPGAAAHAAPAASIRSAQASAEPPRRGAGDRHRDPGRAVGQADPRRQLEPASSERPRVRADRRCCRTRRARWTSSRSAVTQAVGLGIAHAGEPLGGDASPARASSGERALPGGGHELARARRRPRRAGPGAPGPRPPARARRPRPRRACAAACRRCRAARRPRGPRARRAAARRGAGCWCPPGRPAASAASAAAPQIDVARIGALGDRHQLEPRRPAPRARPWPSARRCRSRPSSSARSSSETQRDLSPSAAPRSPQVVIVTSSALVPSRSATQRACASASALPRVPMRISARRPRRRGTLGPSRSGDSRLARSAACPGASARPSSSTLEPEQVAHERHPRVDAVVAQLLHPQRSARAAGG